MKPNYKKYELRKVTRKNYNESKVNSLINTDGFDSIDILTEIYKSFEEIGRVDIFNMILSSWF